MRQKVEIFLCYAHEDEELRKCLEKQLRILQRQGLVEIWHDRQIDAGTEWKSEIDKHLNTAQIILLLISPDFMDSDYCYSIEMEHAMDRHQRGEARVIPVILRPILWESSPFGKLQALPTNAIPVVSGQWHNQDEAFKNISEGICRVVNSFLGLASPDILMLPVVSSNWQHQLTSSPEWQHLSQKASKLLLYGWQQFSPQDRTYLLQGWWQQFSSQDRARLLQAWQQQYQEMEQKRKAQANNLPTGSDRKKKGVGTKESVLEIQHNPPSPYGLWDRLQKRTSPVVGSDKSLRHPVTSLQSTTIFDQSGQQVYGEQHNYAESITINQDADSPRPFTLLELEQIMERVQKQTAHLASFTNLWSLVTFVVFIILVIKFGAFTSIWLIRGISYLITIFIFIPIHWFIDSFIVTPRANKIVQLYTDNTIQSLEELVKEYEYLKNRRNRNN